MVVKGPITATVRILYWRDIPSKVEVEDETCVVTRALSDRYQDLVNKLAKMPPLAGAEASVEEWREVTALMRPGDVISVAMQVLGELEEQFDLIARPYSVADLG